MAEVVNLKCDSNGGEISHEEAAEAVRTLLRFMGENPEREGLLETPNRLLKSYKELFSGYDVNISEVLAKKFRDVSDYQGLVLLKDIELKSTCEHHMQPIIGKVSIGYYPNGEVIGISKLSRLVSTFGRRLQIQERLTAEIAQSLQNELNPKGVAVQVEASHFCMIARGVNDSGSKMITRSFTGCFEEGRELKSEFLQAING